jgi:protein-tyrosine phosphatase
MSHVDLHLHLLPGVDDGARTLDDSLAHARRLVAHGVREATVTPHIGHPWFPVDPGALPELLDELKAALVAERIPLILHPGGEVYCRAVSGLSDADLAAVAHGPTIARWVLLEVPFPGIDAAFVDAIGELRDRGFGVLVGHPERAEGFLSDGLARLRPALAAGALLQVNADSLMGLQGPEPQRGAEHLVRSGLAYVLASDGHPGTREQTLADGAEAARRAGASAVQAWRLTEANPRFLLVHGIPPTPPAPPAYRPGTRREVTRVLEERRRGAPSGA